MVRGETDNTCTRIEAVEHSYSNKMLRTMFQVSKIPKQPTRKVAPVSNTFKYLAREATCRKCKKQGHYHSVCILITILAAIRTDTVNEEPFLGTIEIISTHSKDNQWMVELLLNGKLVQFKIDTGADVTEIQKKYSRNWMEIPYEKQVNLSMVKPSKHQLIMHGRFIGMLTYQQSNTRQEIFIVHKLG